MRTKTEGFRLNFLPQRFNLWRTPRAPAGVKTSTIDGHPSSSEEERPPTVSDLAYDNPLTQNTLNTHEERGQQREEHITPPITLQEAAHLLGVAPDALTSEDGPLCSMRPDLNAERPVVHLMQISVDQHFPKTPADVDQNLQRHLLNVQETVREELVRLAPELHSEGLIECYHRQIIQHLDDLLQNISSSQNHLLLIKWVLQTYLSQALLGHPDLQYTDPIKKVDLLLLTQWVSRAEETFLKNVETDIRRHLENILHVERSYEGHEELYVDTIQCIDAMPREALKISSKLSDQVQEVCLRELLMFLTKYRDEQTDILAKTAKMDKPETKQFFKTLNNCKELKQHIHTKAIQIKESPLKETMTEAAATLENMEAFTLKLLKEIVANIAESHLKKYFKSDNREFFHLIDEVKSLFSELSDYQDVQTRVMDEAYKLIAHIYFKRLIKISQRKLRKSWHPDVGQTVAEDAEHLHNIISYLVPGVGQWNVMLLKVKELLDCKSLEATKMTVGSMQEECYTWSEDLELLPALLQWKGLSRWEIEEVQNVLEDLPSFQPRPTSASWYSCFTRLLSCCTRESTSTS